MQMGGELGKSGIHVLIYVHLLTKTRDQMRGCQNTYTRSDRGACVKLLLCVMDGANLWSQMDMPICTDACTWSDQDVGSNEGWLGCVYRATYFHVTMQRGWVDVGSQVDMPTCTDAFTPSDQGVA